MVNVDHQNAPNNKTSTSAPEKIILKLEFQKIYHFYCLLFPQRHNITISGTQKTVLYNLFWTEQAPR